MTVSVWTVIGPSMLNAFNTRYAAEQADEAYNGPMDDQSYAILTSAVDIPVVQRMYKTKNVQGQTPFTLFNMNFVDQASAIAAMDYLEAEWPGKQIEVQGAWHWNGLQMGQYYTYDEEGAVTGVEGTPYYTLEPTCYRLMPDVVVYDEQGDVVSTTPATSNADLRDINLVAGQSPRSFT